MALDLIYGAAPSTTHPFESPVQWGEDGGTVVSEVLSATKPSLIARIGSSELACVSFYIRWRARGPLRMPYPPSLRQVMRFNAGVFPADDATLDRFSARFLEAVSLTDVMGVWFNRNEHRILRGFCPGARLVHLESLNCVVHADPWTARLEGKRVLVVHPFARTIESQYRTRRELLFENPRMLPAFELLTMPAVQSAAGSDCGYATWLDALDDMCSRIEGLDFDVAIIGAGAYGLPLGATVKQMGRQAVHLGGATQLLFGIRGRRWEVESPDDIAPLFNEHWVRPSAEETPDRSDLLERGCYW